ncbi:uncharacterized protein [Physcomitrium patens]|uniref:Uncharacterized protein n=1 Tax=Physcomitrium patens TaxID=3218 RepID=A9TB55_PHYPA|nr:uncharacterized protein LOC112293365 [Physcomitrium patens]PNR37945.1 hypothetical protein PHYPA_021055 [Physcomitrium patens]|eukprot:XP_024398439.1 uncharacterized protein LOC112293365 [Physcomitrella patens]
MGAWVKLAILCLMVNFMVAASISVETPDNDKVCGPRLLRTEAPQANPRRAVYRPGCSVGPVCPPNNTIVCENDAETGETGGCICTLVHICHPERKNCTYYVNGMAETTCGF